MHAFGAVYDARISLDTGAARLSLNDPSSSPE